MIKSVSEGIMRLKKALRAHFKLAGTKIGGYGEESYLSHISELDGMRVQLRGMAKVLELSKEEFKEIEKEIKKELSKPRQRRRKQVARREDIVELL